MREAGEALALVSKQLPTTLLLCFFVREGRGTGRKAHVTRVAPVAARGT